MCIVLRIGDWHLSSSREYIIDLKYSFSQPETIYKLSEVAKQFWTKFIIHLKEDCSLPFNFSVPMIIYFVQVSLKLSHQHKSSKLRSPSRCPLGLNIAAPRPGTESYLLEDIL